MGETVVLPAFILGIWFHEVLDLLDAQGICKGNTFLAIVRGFKLCKIVVIGCFLFLVGGAFLAALDLLMETCLVCEATRVSFSFLKEGTVTDLKTGTARSPFSLTWTQVFNLGAGIGMVLEAGMEGAMVGSPSWITKVMRVGMAEKEK
jgi:hypothetical protein